MKDIEKGFTGGLLGGYAGEGHTHTVKRGGIIEGKASHVPLEDGVYHDEWFTGERSGGGQEVLAIGDQKFTRVYAGGASNEAFLDHLGLTVDDVNGYLVDKLKALGDRTRLFKDCVPQPDGKWQYSYKVTDVFGNSGTTTSVESIHYNNMRVFVHAFVLCPIA